MFSGPNTESRYNTAFWVKERWVRGTQAEEIRPKDEWRRGGVKEGLTSRGMT